ncbi:hypothetical protein DPEC_G00368580 [Dallia pectoralis]|nr:hypothetical protein DPEC_G00368580 [Dallia pectoralis]
MIQCQLQQRGQRNRSSWGISEQEVQQKVQGEREGAEGAPTSCGVSQVAQSWLLAAEHHILSHPRLCGDSVHSVAWSLPPFSLSPLHFHCATHHPSVHGQQKPRVLDCTWISSSLAGHQAQPFLSKEMAMLSGFIRLS